jgi:hypothetical protein
VDSNESSNTGALSKQKLPVMASHNSGADRSAPASVASSGSRGDFRSAHDNSRHWEAPAYNKDVLRHRALSSVPRNDRDRQRDDPYWSGRDSSRSDQRDRGDTRERTRFHNYTLSTEDRQRSRNAAIARTRGIPSPPVLPQRDSWYGDAPPRIIANPVLNAKPRGPDAHPQSEWAIAQNGPSPPEGDLICPPPDPNYVANEEERITTSRLRPFRERRDGLAPVRRYRDEYVLGMWTTFQICMLEQAYNLCALVNEGSQESYEFFLLIVGDRAAFPLEFRTEGEAYLLSNQQEIEHSYWIVTTGAPRASRTQRHPTQNTRRQNDSHS